MSWDGYRRQQMAMVERNVFRLKKKKEKKLVEVLLKMWVPRPSCARADSAPVLSKPVFTLR